VVRFVQLVAAHVRERWLATWLGIALIATAHFTYHVYLAIGFVVLILALRLAIVLVQGLIMALHRPSRERYRANLRDSVFSILFGLLMIVGLESGRRWLDRQLNDSWAPLIAKVEQHKLAHGAYPESLDGIGTEPCGRGGYNFHAKQGIYCITCMTYGFNHHSYCSDRPYWHDWD
jgi:4-amino-4-deoxy-L-arabinose transferase-like glycosyltransferase